MKKIYLALMCIASLVIMAACGGNPNKKAGNGKPEAKEIIKSSDKKATGTDLPKYPYGKIVLNEKHDDGSKTMYVSGTTLEECQQYCASLLTKGFVVVERSGIKYDNTIQDDDNGEGRYIDFWAVDKKSNTDCKIKFYPDKNETAFTKNGERIVYQVDIGIKASK